MRVWRSEVRRRGGAALLGAAVLAGSLAGSPTSARAEDTPADYPVPSTPADYRRPLGKLVPPEGALFGAHLQEQSTVQAEQAQYEQLEADTGRTMDINMYYYPFDDQFPTWRERYDLAHGRFPLISWGCHDVDEILRGEWDALIDLRADSMAALGKPFFLRWCWEMDGRRPEKAKKVKSPAKFIAAWQYLWKRVYDRGATNVVRVWCPNARGFKTGDAQPFYPGDEWVDWVCTDGYNWAPEREKDWRSFVEIFDDSYAFAVSRYKPLMIGEWGAMERNPGDKAQWIREAHAASRDLLPAIAGIVSFAVDAHHDWRVTTAEDTYEAFKQWARDPYFNPPDPPFTPGPGENTAPGPLPPAGAPADEPADPAEESADPADGSDAAADDAAPDDGSRAPDEPSAEAPAPGSSSDSGRRSRSK